MGELVVRNIAGEDFIRRAVANSNQEANKIAKDIRKTTIRKVRVIGNGVYVGPSRSVRSRR